MNEKILGPNLASSRSNLGVAYNNLAIDYVKDGKFEEAILAFRKAQRINPDLAETLEELKNREEFGEAVAAYETVVEAHENLGDICFNQGKMDEAIDAFQAVIHLDPRHAKAHYHLAAAYSLENEKMPAIEFLRKAVALEKDYVEQAKTDRDFENIRGAPAFDEIVNTTEGF